MTTSSEPDDVGENWAGTYRYAARKVVTVNSVDEVANLVAAGGQVRALGTRHSFNDLADTSGTLIDLGALRFEPTIDESRQRVTVPAGMTYGHLGRILEERGWALANLGSLPHISVGGACATGTHGSGSHSQNLSAAVCAVELVVGRGGQLTLEEDDPRFPGGVVALGALGIATKITLRIEPTYQVRQDVFTDMAWSDLAKLDSIMDSSYSVSLFTRWNGIVDQVWLKSRVRDNNAEPARPSEGATPAANKVMSPASDELDNTTIQGGIPGSWNERLPHFRFDETPSNGNEIQSEYFVAREDGLAALRTLEPLARDFAPHLLISELRTVAADNLWLSPAYERDSLTIHFTWKNQPKAIRQLLPKIEEALKPFKARPHWGKWFAADGTEIAALYDQLPEFIALAHQLDPDGQFRNDYLSRVLGLEQRT
jgi:xylitol oxidase